LARSKRDGRLLSHRAGAGHLRFALAHAYDTIISMNQQKRIGAPWVLPHPDLSTTHPGEYEAQWMALVDASHARLIAYTGCFLRDTEQAKDAVQDTYVKACRSSGLCTTRSDAYSWIMRIAKNTCLDRLKHASQRMAVQSLDDEETEVVIIDPGPTTLRSLADEEQMGLVADAIREAELCVNPQLLLTWRMRIVDGLSVEEVADFLDVAAGTVGSRTSRCSALILNIYNRLNREREGPADGRAGPAKERR
jgi:RNA polymerase sigma-70 factor, ECF subfamily